MFHWQKATGKRVDEAYEAFRNYNGKASYEELGLGIPTSMPQEEDDSEWSHMSDCDDTGFAPDEWGGHGLREDEGTSCTSVPEGAVFKVQCCGQPNGVQDHVSRIHDEEDHVDYVHEIQTQKDDAHEYDHN